MYNSKLTVRNYSSNDVLEGSPSDDLVEKSRTEKSGTGAVAAYLDDDGVWQYVAPSEESFYRDHRGCEVVTVWVEGFVDGFAPRSVTSHCAECGAEVEGDEVCVEHPNASIETISTLLASDGTELGAGTRVEGGVPGTDSYDTGIVDEVVGDDAWVSWDSGVRTLAHASELRAEVTSHPPPTLQRL